MTGYTPLLVGVTRDEFNLRHVHRPQYHAHHATVHYLPRLSRSCVGPHCPRVSRDPYWMRT
eukprot:5680646-Pyramimonas_sp.AAC.1